MDVVLLPSLCQLVRTFGLIGSCRVSAGEHAVVESKPDNVRPDWRLAEPFAEMKEFADEFKLEELDSHHHGHVPYPVLLLHLRKAWEAEVRCCVSWLVICTTHQKDVAVPFPECRTAWHIVCVVSQCVLHHLVLFVCGMLPGKHTPQVVP